MIAANVPAGGRGADAADSALTGPGSQRVVKTCVVILTVLAVTQALYAATAVLLPTVAAFVAALALRPVVRLLTRKLKIPVMIGAGLVLASVVGLFSLFASQLIVPATEWAERAPIRFHLLRLQRKLEPVRAPLADLTEASDELSRVATAAAVDDSEAIQQVVVKPPSLINEVVSSSTQIVVGIFLFLVLTFFCLAKGDVLIGRLFDFQEDLKPTSVDEDAIVAHPVERSVSIYLLNVSVINAGLGVTIGLACWAVGVPNPVLWGVMAAILNFLPYIGGLIGAAIVLGVSLLSFESTAYAFVAPCIYLAVTTIEGNFVTPSVLGRSMSLNPLVVILSLTYWTWLWGLGGAILAVPLLAIATSLFRQFDSTQRLAAILSE